MKRENFTRPFTEFPNYYPRLLEAIIAFGDVVQALVQTIIISFGLISILLVMLIVEHHGIQDGLDWFLTSGNMSWLGAFGFVMFNLVIEFQIAYIEHESKYKQERAKAWSLRLLLDEGAYRLGWGKSWKARPQSPARRFLGMRTWVTVAIFVLALSGRMKLMILQVSYNEPDAANRSAIPLEQGLTNLQTQSTLADTVTWFGGTLFTMVALIGVQGLTHYIAWRVIEIKADMKKRIKTQKAAATRARRQSANGRPEVQAVQLPSQVTRRVNPIKVTVDGKTRYECPGCHKQMSKQGWHGSEVSPGHKSTCGAYLDLVDRITSLRADPTSPPLDEPDELDLPRLLLDQSSESQASLYGSSDGLG